MTEDPGTVENMNYYIDLTLHFGPEYEQLQKAGEAFSTTFFER